jgi:hypothetical protein
MRKYIIGVVACAIVSVAAPSRAKLINPCLSQAQTAGGVLLICPQGDGPTLADIGATIYVTVVDPSGVPIEYMPYPDFWVESYPRTVGLCHGAYSLDADANTDANGQTTMSGSIAGGGYSGGPIYAVCEAIYIGLDEGVCDEPLPLVLVSPDIDNDGTVGLLDLAMFGGAFGNPSVDPRFDFNGDGSVNLIDFVLFADHFGHVCDY